MNLKHKNYNDNKLKKFQSDSSIKEDVEESDESMPQGVQQCAQQ